MQAISLDRALLAQTAVVSAATFAAVALLGLVLAYWTWVLLAPPQEPRALATVATGERMGAAHGLFGSAPRSQTAAAPTGIAVRLLGVVAAGDGRSGYAVMQLAGGQSLAVREGEEVGPGIRLVAVDSRQVTLERGGIRESLALPEKNPAPLRAPLPAQ